MELNEEQLIEQTKYVVLDSFSMNTKKGDTTLYTQDALDNITSEDMYINCKNGEAYAGDYVKCKSTKAKSMITGFIIGQIEHMEMYQLIAELGLSEQIDARGEYARSSLMIVSKNKKLKAEREK